MDKKTTVGIRRMVVPAAVLMVCALTACKKKPAAAPEPRVERREKALMQPVTRSEAETKCLSIERAIDLAELVETDAGRVTGLGSADKVDEMMRAMGYAKSSLTHIEMQGQAVIYTRGCAADELGSMTDVTDAQATLVTIAGEGQPATAALVTISMTDGQVYNRLKREMAENGFTGSGPEYANGTGYKIFADKFLSGTGFVIQISREP